MKLINKHMESASKKLDREEVETFVEKIINSKRVFLVGAGRSGLMAKAFAMRLMHLDTDVHVIGETITPSVREDDILIAVSGSGETTFVVSAAEMGKNIGVKVVGVTSYPDSTLGKLADHTVVLPGRVETAEKKDYIDRQVLGEYESLTPMGTLFEQTALAFFDGVIACLMKKLGKKERDLKEKHATIE